ncbi:chloride channel protein [Shewanella intestini]|uniref:Chloride channel protein n=1 Tax=Shewanella intestini TaxID=2017544 RepID=A0ABS5HXW5_9GAMM|nr:chloride channel protein [Shewanella sp. XMDDZSB0408]MBR9726615.1 chloride channel protein [Shewanella intestini]MRG34819.1 chloride channel protein [Shewanella sp. XMDDZSB0408]
MQNIINKAAIINAKRATRKYLRNEFRDKLSQAKISAQLCTLALLFAVFASAIIILFRVLLDWAAQYTAPQATQFTEALVSWRTYLPFMGALTIWVLYRIGSKRYRRMGIAYVLHRVKIHYGKVPLPSAMGQFFQALAALISNFSVGKEGPAIHLGAVTASVLAEKFQLPDNSVRIMCASGIAAGIAATFNAPLAAVLFVFEVIVREYKIHYFFPIMLSAICGALSSQLAFGNVHEYDLINVIHIPLDHYPILLLGGVALGVAAATFNFSLLKVTAKSQKWPLYQRLLLAGMITTLVGLFIPQALGSGDLAIHEAISENPSVWFLIMLLGAKTIATIAAIGLGIPGGLIGPLYGIGAVLGAILALIMMTLFPEVEPFIGLYTVIGMTAMMGVCLSAPLAALVALLELTNDASIILPAMFVTIPAYLIAYQALRAQSVFLKQLDIMGLGYKVPPLNQGLQKKGVRTLMDSRFVIVKDDNELLLEVLKRADGRPVLVKNADDEIEMLRLEMQSFEQNTTLTRHKIEGLSDNKTLDEAYELLAPKRTGQVYIYQGSTQNVVGVISWSHLQKEIRSGEL